MSLTVTYIRHAKQTSHRLIDPPIAVPPPPSTLPYDYIITSPYLGCRQTAIALNGRSDRPIFVDTTISEFSGAKKPRPGKMDVPSLEYGPVPLWSETWAECQTRLDAHWNMISNLSGHILVVTHGVVVNYVHQRAYGTKLAARGRDVPFVGGTTISF